ncbi:UNVERIFIED_CONTAM: Caffeoylshikimate esterase [Sesamum radiatum]|uniref:Caffeoylshikimate esterase n=1 Tax=Sesamum radiatum TaxID=300843 RepID=A0AAW2UXX8_SESRA
MGMGLAYRVRQELQRSTALYLQMAAFLFSESSGYGMECSNFMKGVGTKLASHGYAVFGIDHEGHGRSMGARCYIKRFDNIVNDCSDHFKSICGKKSLILNFSTGRVQGKEKISEKLKPHPVVISLLTTVEDVIPKWKIVPTKDIIDSAFKDPIKREEVGLNIVSASNKLIYQQKPRLKTALEMLRTSMNLEDSLNEVTLPFFVLHGEADIVTDPEVSRALYEQASSSDKTIKLYQGMWHGLTAGEPDDNIEIVFSDIISWLDRRAGDYDSTLSMKSIKHSTPSPMHNGLTATASPMSLQKQKHAKKRSHVKYLCGLNGRGFYHHTAV